MSWTIFNPEHNTALTLVASRLNLQEVVGEEVDECIYKQNSNKKFTS